MPKVRGSTLSIAAGSVALAGLILAACQHYGRPLNETAANEAIPDRPSYNWDVRPILSENCFRCHGHDPETRKAGLRLDLAEAAYGRLPEDPGKRAIVRGNPGKSELIARITTGDAEARMPPKDMHKVLSPAEVAILTRWIKQGAKYEQHWAYIAPRQEQVQKTAWDKQAINPIDRYVFAKLNKVALSPSPQADRETLINRVSVDLTGLPPTLQEVDAFVADKDPNAYEHVVDRLLASSAYAERQAQTWLDVARYADTDGYLNDDYGRFQSPYRDWVISAFQRNIPYDRFVTWQLAGDLLPNPTREQILATAFARSGKKSNEGGIIDEEYRVEYVNERTELVGKAFLGLTVGCAKCHDHKYDVISQADYYSMGGFFNSIDERGIHAGAGGTPMGPVLPWPTATQTKKLTVADSTVQGRWNAYQAALAAARRRAAAVVNAVPVSGRGAFLQQAIDADTQAYYPFDKAYKASFEPLMIDPAPARPGAPPRPGVKPPKPEMTKASDKKDGKAAPAKIQAAAGGRSARRAALGPPDADTPRRAGDEIDKALDVRIAHGYTNAVLNGHSDINRHQLMVGLEEDKLQWTPDGRPNQPPAFINNAALVPGAHGTGLLLNNSVFAADRSVGQFDRTQPFTIDLWVKLRADKPYEEGTIFYNMYGTRAAGYHMLVENNKLRFEMIHQAPSNMLAVRTTGALPKGRWTHVAVTYDGNSNIDGLKLYVDGKPAQTEVLAKTLTRSIKVRGGHSYQSGSYYGFSSGVNKARLELKDGAIDELRVLTRALTPVEIAYLHSPRLIGSASPADLHAQMIDIAAAKDPAVVQAWADLKDARDAEQRIETKVLDVMVLGEGLKPRTNYILDRGLYNSYKGTTPTQALPSVFPWNPKLPRNRLGLTQWLFDPKNPLTARVYVNRMWQSHFGAGLAPTIEDFGTQGSNPSNPQLLDYLAVEFQRSGWDIKHMHKLMVMSATYRQSSNISREALEKDPRNVYLARGARFRLPAEMIRDDALAASGLLVRKMGGDSVFPYQPEGVWDGVGIGVSIYPTQTDVPADELHRRTMYTFMRRNAPFPSLAVFDVPDRSVSSVVRNVSNTPLQALVLMNDTQFVEAYRKLAERVMTATPDPDRQLTMLFRLGARRHPTASELADMRRFLETETVEMNKNPDAARKLLSNGVAPVNASLDRARLAAMTTVAGGVMNSPSAYTLR